MSWLPKDKVIVPVDFSADSLAAVDTALTLVARPEGLTVVHVLPDLSVAEPAELWEAVDYGVMRDRAEQALRQRLADDRFRGVQSAVLFGDAGQAIVDFAREQSADLIVLPSHGRSGWRRLLLGSVAERVVRLAECPVLVLRTHKE
jgi:nucleotide-binding universal stress UspA family protein